MVIDRIKVSDFRQCFRWIAENQPSDANQTKKISQIRQPNSFINKIDIAGIDK